MVDRRYQVFISSTYRDLIEERRAAMMAVLEGEHIPAGMELFPAGDDKAWDLIKDVIDKSDYYVLIVGGRYGSCDEEGLSYTEKEYDYAVASGKPIIALLHKDPERIPRGKTETDKDSWARLEAFRKKVQSKHTCKFWDTPDELSGKISLSLTSEIRRHPQSGWVRATDLLGREALQRMEELRVENATLREQLEIALTSPPQGAKNLASGSERITLKTRPYYGGKRGVTAELSWDDIWRKVGPLVLHEAKEGVLSSALGEAVASKSGEGASNHMESDSFQQVKIQLIALGLMKKSQRKHTPGDTASYWSITTYGESVLFQLMAIPSTPALSLQLAD